MRVPKVRAPYGRPGRSFEILKTTTTEKDNDALNKQIVAATAHDTPHVPKSSTALEGEAAHVGRRVKNAPAAIASQGAATEECYQHRLPEQSEIVSVP